MRQNAVSSAPQKDVPTHSEEISATIPTVVEACCTRSISSVSVLSAALAGRSSARP